MGLEQPILKRELFHFSLLFRGDSIAKRCAFNDYVDSLNKDGLVIVTDYKDATLGQPDFKML